MSSHLPPEVLSDVLAAAKAKEWLSRRSLSFLDHAVYLTGNKRREKFSDAFATVKYTNSRAERCDIMASLRRHLSPELLSDILAAARAVGWQISRSEALEAFGPDLSETLLGCTLAKSRSSRNEFARSQTLIELAPYLSPELASEALTVARGIVREDPRSRALVALVPSLPTESKALALAEALSAAEAIEDEDVRASALGALAACVPQGLGFDFLSAAKKIKDKEARCELLVEICTSKNQRDVHITNQSKQELINVSVQITRQLVFSVILKMYKDAKSRGLETEILQLYQAIVAVCEWYP